MSWVLKSLIEMEYGITSRSSTSVNPNSNAILELVHQDLENLVQAFNKIETYVH